MDKAQNIYKKYNSSLKIIYLTVFFGLLSDFSYSEFHRSVPAVSFGDRIDGIDIAEAEGNS